MSESSRPATSKARTVVGLIAYAAVLATARGVIHARTADIGMADETGYLQSGLELLRAPLPKAESSPMYAVWYWLLSHLVRDPITLYDVSWGALVFAFLASFALLLHRMGVSAWGSATAISVASMLSCFMVWPYVTTLSATMVLVAMNFAVTRNAPVASLALASSTFAVATFVRPEMLVGFAITFGAACVASVRHRQWRWLAVPAATALGLCVGFGLPLGGGRTTLAFGQHYAMNITHASGANIDFWYAWKSFVAADFGGIVSPLAALMANPEAFGWHVAINLANVVPNWLEIMKPAMPWSPEVRTGWAACLAILMTTGLVRALGRFRSDEMVQRAVVIILAVLVPWALSVSIIAPRLHYFLAPLAVTSVLAIHGLREMASKNGRFVAIAIVGATCVSTGWASYSHSVEWQPNRATVRALRGLDPSSEVMTILEPDFGRGVYTKFAFESILQNTCEPFAECVETRKPSVIIANWRSRATYRADPGFEQFLRSPRAFGYEGKLVPKANVVIYRRLERGPVVNASR